MANQRRSGVCRGLAAEHIEAALHEWWGIGRTAFLARHGRRPAERYVVVTERGDADALALVVGARAIAGLM